MTCRNCGADLPAAACTDAVAMCPECGTPIPRRVRENPVIPPAYPQEWKRMVAQHEASRLPKPPNAYAVLSTWDYLWSFLLLSLPVAGLIIAIVWACGGAQNRNRTNMGRAWLLLAGAVTLIALGIAIGAAWQNFSMFGSW